MEQKRLRGGVSAEGRGYGEEDSRVVDVTTAAATMAATTPVGAIAAVLGQVGAELVPNIWTFAARMSAPRQ